MIPLAGITEWLGLEWNGPDLPYPSGSQAILIFIGFNVVSILLTVVVARRVVLGLPVDYFTTDEVPESRRRPLDWIAANAGGLAVLVVGIIFLLSPGQGLFMILIGLVMLDLPGKRRYERKIAGNAKVLRLLNHMRSRRGLPLLATPPVDSRPLFSRAQVAAAVVAIALLAIGIGRWVYVAYR